MAQHIPRDVLTNAHGRHNTSRDYNKMSAPAPRARTVTRCRSGQTRNRDEFLRGRSTEINP